MKSKHWELCDLREEKISHNDPYLVKMYDDYRMIECLLKTVTFKNQDLNQAVGEVTLVEKRNVDTLNLQSRVVEVKFGNSISLTKLNTLLSERKLDQLNETEYENGFSFTANSHHDVVNILSTLNELCRFSGEMKNIIVNCLASKMTVQQKLSLRETLFSKYTKAKSIFSASTTTPSELTVDNRVGLTTRP